MTGPAPDFSEPVVGFRAWRVDRGELVPWSAGRAGAWTPGVNQARCLHTGLHPRQPPPVARCSCGLYALADPADRRLRPAEEAVGAIVAWGAVEVHATGFRAQYAAIVALALPAACDDAHAARLRAAAARYGVPLVPVEHLSAAALEYGRPIAFESILDAAPRAVTIHREPVPPLSEQGAEGIAIDEHLAVVVERGGVRLAPTPPLARALGGEAPRWAEAGTTVAAGDTLGQVGDVLLRAPVGGVVAAPAGGAAAGAAPSGAAAASGPAPSGAAPASGRAPSAAAASAWLAPTAWEADAGAISWGAAGRRFYAADLADAHRRRADPFAPLRTHWVRAHARVRSAVDVLEALREQRGRPRFASTRELRALLGEALDLAAADPAAAKALARLEARVVWRLHAPEADLVLDADGPALAAPREPREDDVVLHASAATADDWLAGRLDLPAALRRREVQSSAPPAAILRAASVLKPLHARYAEASSRASSFAS